jgi:hypothetical protein
MKKLLISTPAFDGKVNGSYAISLAETFALLLSQGIETRIGIRHSGSLLMSERNAILKEFLAGDYTHLMCVDADIAWQAKSVLQLLSYDQDFVGACYPARGADAFFLRPEVDEDGNMIETSQHLLRMAAIPAGFMLLSRRMIEAMCRHFAHLYYTPKNADAPENGTQTGRSGYALFNCELIDGEFWGEDYVFCLRAREAGFSVLVDPRIELNHAGIQMSLQSVIDVEKKPIVMEREYADQKR